MKAVSLWLGGLLAVWLQAYFLTAWRPFGVLPNLLLVVLTVFAWVRPASQTLVLAVFSGLVLDLTSGTDFGLRMAFYSVFGLAVLFIKQLGAGESWWSDAALVAAGTLVYNLAVLAALALSGGFELLPVARLILLELVLNLLLLVLLRRLLLWWFEPAADRFLVPG